MSRSEPSFSSISSQNQGGGGNSQGASAPGFPARVQSTGNQHPPADSSAKVSHHGSGTNLAAMDGLGAAAPAAAVQYGTYGQVSQQYSHQTSTLSQSSSQSASQRQLHSQLQQQQQSATGGASGAQFGPPVASQLAGVKPSSSGGSLLQYEATAGVPPTQGTLSQSQSHASLLVAGPGSLCAHLPRYVRYPPIEAVVFGWGVSEDGQLGVADGGADVPSPKVVESLLGVQFSGRSFCRTPLVAGSRNTLALDASGQVWSFGWNDRGTLGHGHRSKERKPQRIAALKGIRVVQVAIGGWHCLALSDKGTMFAWGGNEYGQCGSVVPGQRDIVEPLPVDLGLGPNQRVRQVSAGGMHSLALLEDGTVWQWGENWGDFSMHPVRTPRPVPGAVAVAAVSCGAFHNLLLTAGGRVLSWGMNDYGQLGNGSTTYATAPRPVLDMDGVVVADIAAGGWHSCALSSAGEVWVWGRGEYGRLGLGDRSGSSKLRPQKVRGLESHVVVQVAAGGSHTMALTATARLFVWGRGAFGRLGMGGQGDRDCYHPVECTLPGGTERWRVAAIGAGGRHSICLAIPVRDPGSAGSPDLLHDDDDAAGARHRHDAHRHSSDEYDVDGYSEPSLYDKDLHYEHAPGEASSPQRGRRQTASGPNGTADGSVPHAYDESEGALGAAASVSEAGPDESAARAEYYQGTQVNCLPSWTAASIDGVSNGGGAYREAAGSNLLAASVPPPPLSAMSSDGLIAVESLSSTPTARVLPAGAVTAVIGISAHTSSAQQLGTPVASPAIILTSSASGTAGTPVVDPPSALAPIDTGRPASPYTAPGSVSGGNSGSAAGSGGGGAISPADNRSSPSSPSAPSPPQQLSPLPPAPPAVVYGMRRSGSAVGALSQLAQILPEPAAVAAAALLDADSDLAPPRGLAAAAAAASAAGLPMSTGASRPSSAQGSCGVSRGGSVTGMQRYRTVFGGGGEEEDEAVQAAEAAEAAAEEQEGSGTGEEDVAQDLDNAQDDTDEDQGMYDSGGAVQHPRSPSLMQRPRSPSMPLSPHRLPSFNSGATTSAVVIGGGNRGPSPPPSMSGGAGALGVAAGSLVTANAVSGSPSSRALLASYGSPRVPSAMMQQSTSTG